MADPFKDRLQRLAQERGMTLSQVRLDAYDPTVRGTNPESLKRAISRERPLHIEQIEALAKAVGVPPDEFPEYQLAVARRLLDEQQVGLDAAIAALQAFRLNSETAARERVPTAAKAKAQQSSASPATERDTTHAPRRHRKRGA